MWHCIVSSWLAVMAIPAFAVCAFGMELNFTINIPERRIQGIAVESGVLWAVHAPTDGSDRVKIAAINPMTGAILSQSVEFAWNGRGICSGEGSLWVTDALNDVIHRVDPTTLTETSYVSTPGTEPTGIAFDGTNLWLADPWAQKIFELTTNGVVLDDCSIPNTFHTGLEWADGGLWAPTDSTVITHYSTSCVVDSVLNFPMADGASVFDVATEYGNWYVSSQHRIHVFNAVAPGLVLTGRVVTGVAAGARLLWAVHQPMGNSDSSRITAFSLITGGKVLESTDLDWGGRGICIGEGSLWIVDARQDRVWRADPENLAIMSWFSTPGSEPSGITFDGTYLWLTDPNSQRIYALTTNGSVVQECVVPNEFRSGLEWADGGAWTPTDSSVVSHYLPDCTLDSTIGLTVPPGTRVFDIAMSNGRWYAATVEKIHVLPPPDPFLQLPGRRIDGLVFDSETLWMVHAPEGRSDSTIISALDPVTGTVLRSSTEMYWNGRGICSAEGSLWIADALGDVVRRIDPQTLTETTSFNTPGTEPTGLAYDGAYLWLADPYAQKIYRLTTGGEVVEECSIPNEYHTGLEWEHGELWAVTDSTSISPYRIPGCTVGAPVSFAALPTGTRIFDVASSINGWFVSSGDRVYAIPDVVGPTTDAGEQRYTPGTGMGLRVIGANPMKTGTAVTFNLARGSELTLQVVDVAGRVRSVVRAGYFDAGSHTVRWDGSDGLGRRLPSGVYFLRLQSGKDVRSEKIVVVH